MSPVWIIEGAREASDPRRARDVADQRFSALAEAVRAHQLTTRGHQDTARPRDERLYRRLRELVGEL